MTFPTDIISRLVPDGAPSFPFFSPDFFSVSGQYENNLLRRSYLWSSAITSTIFQYASRYPVESISSGFVHVESHILSLCKEKNIPIEQSYVFGGCLLVHSIKDNLEQEVIFIETNGREFPLIINYGRIELHSCPPSPTAGSATCWIKDTAMISRWDQGILTCRHVVFPTTIGATVNLNSTSTYLVPTSGTVSDFDEFSIDAAIIKVSSTDYPTGLSAMPIINPIAPGQAVSLVSSGQIGTVTRVFQLDKYYGNLCGHRIFTDFHGSHGDSGSLLKIDGKLEAVGMYMGSTPSGSKNKEGIYQSLDQVAKYFELELYY